MRKFVRKRMGESGEIIVTHCESLTCFVKIFVCLFFVSHEIFAYYLIQLIYLMNFFQKQRYLCQILHMTLKPYTCKYHSWNINEFYLCFLWVMTTFLSLLVFLGQSDSILAFELFSFLRRIPVNTFTSFIGNTSPFPCFFLRLNTSVLMLDLYG